MRSSSTSDSAQLHVSAPIEIYRTPNKLFPYHAWPTVCRDENGILYVICSGERASHICPFGKNLLFISTDEGESWSPPMIINDTWMDDRDAGICCLGGKTLIMSYFNHPVSFYLGLHERGHLESVQPVLQHDMIMSMVESYRLYTPEMNTAGSFVRRSENGGKTWMPAVKAPVSSPHGPVPASGGRLLWLGKEKSDTVTESGEIFFAQSLDKGDTWETLCKIKLPDGLTTQNMHEPDVLELSDGTLLGAIRAQGKEVDHAFTMYFCHSYDGGRTWTVPAPSHISGSPPHLMLLPDNRVLCTYARREQPFGIRAMISADGGKSFGEEMVLDSAEELSYAGDIGYPATVTLGDGSLLTVYYRIVGQDPAPSIVCVKWKL